MRLLAVLSAFSFALAVSPLHAAIPDATRDAAAAWLLTRVDSQGRVGTVPLRDGSEMLQALGQQPGRATPDVAGFLRGELNQSGPSHHDLAWLSLGLSRVDSRGSADAFAQLWSGRNADEGFGFRPSEPSSTLDTVLAARALAQQRGVPSSDLSRVLARLLAEQRSDGSFGHLDNDGDVAVTAQAIRTLLALGNRFNVSGATQAALTWLEAQRRSDGTFSTGSTQLEDTALAHLALSLGGRGQPSTESWLLSSVQVNGSFGGNAYATALVIETADASHLNVRLVPDSLDAGGGLGLVGQSRTLTVVVENRSGVNMSAGAVVRFTRGVATTDPLIGEVTLPQLAPLGTTNASLVWNTGALYGAVVVAAHLDPASVLDDAERSDNIASISLRQAYPPPAGVMAGGEPGFIDLQWTAVTGTSLLGYRLHRDGLVIAPLVTTTTFRDTGVREGVSYTYELASLGTDGMEGPKSPRYLITAEAPPGGIDLRLLAFDFTMGPGSTLNVSVTNRGLTAAPASTVAVFYRRDDSPNAVSIATLAVPPLAAGMGTVLNRAWVAPTQPGTYSVVARVDPLDGIVESDESNNEVRHTLIVAAPDSSSNTSSSGLQTSGNTDPGAGCRFDLPSDSPVDESLFTVTVGGATVPRDPLRKNGWSLDAASRVLTVAGTACTDGATGARAHPENVVISYRVTSLTQAAGNPCSWSMGSTAPNGSSPMSVRVRGQDVPRDATHTNGWDTDPATGFLTFYGAACTSPSTGITGAPETLVVTIRLAPPNRSSDPATGCYLTVSGALPVDLNRVVVRINGVDIARDVNRNDGWDGLGDNALGFFGAACTDPDHGASNPSHQVEILVVTPPSGNSATGVAGQPPDFQFPSGTIEFSPSHDALMEGVPFALAGVLQNRGVGGGTDVSLDLYDGDPDEGGVPLGSVVLPVVGAFGLVPFQLEGLTLAPGLHTLHLIADAAERYLEPNEGNNEEIIVIDVDGLTPVLRVHAALVALPPTAEFGSTIVLSAVVTNTGNRPLGDVSVQVEVVSDETGAVVYSRSASLGALPKRAITLADLASFIPQRNGTYHLTLTAQEASSPITMQGGTLDYFVGPFIEGSITTDTATVSLGNPQVEARIRTHARLSSLRAEDPLLQQVTDAASKGSAWSSQRTLNWQNCFGCHVQSQGLVSAVLADQVSVPPSITGIYDLSERMLSYVLPTGQVNGGSFVYTPQWLGVWSLSHDPRIGNDSGCTPGYHCGGATTCENRCRSAADCPLEHRCTADGRCESVAEAPPCDQDRDCASGTYCGPDAQCVRRCQGAADCPGGGACDSRGRCAAPSVVACSVDTDCASGFHCSGSGTCAFACVRDSQCATGATCAATGRCVESGGCSSDAACPAGQYCGADGRCDSDCSTDADCPFRATCSTRGRCAVVPAQRVCRPPATLTNLDVFTRAAVFLAGQQRPDGTFFPDGNDLSYRDPSSTPYALVGLTRAYEVSGDDRLLPAISLASDWLMAQQLSWHSTSFARARILQGLNAALNFWRGQNDLQRPSQLEARRDAFIVALTAAQQGNGSWEDDTGLTAVVLYALLTTGHLGRDDPQMLGALVYLLNAQQLDGSWGSFNGGNTNIDDTTMVMLALPEIIKLLNSLDFSVELELPSNIDVRTSSPAISSTQAVGSRTRVRFDDLVLRDAFSSDVRLGLTLNAMEPNEERPIFSQADLVHVLAVQNGTPAVSRASVAVGAPSGLTFTYDGPEEGLEAAFETFMAANRGSCAAPNATVNTLLNQISWTWVPCAAGAALYAESLVCPLGTRTSGRMCFPDPAPPLQEVRTALDIPTVRAVHPVNLTVDALESAVEVGTPVQVRFDVSNIGAGILAPTVTLLVKDAVGLPVETLAVVPLHEPSWQPVAGYARRMAISVELGATPVNGGVVSVPLDLTSALAAGGFSDAVLPSTLRLFEVRNLALVETPGAFLPSTNFHPSTDARGTLSMYLPGFTGAFGRRQLVLVFDVAGATPHPDTLMTPPEGTGIAVAWRTLRAGADLSVSDPSLLALENVPPETAVLDGIHYAFATTGPTSTMPADGFVAELTGALWVETAGSHSLELLSDDGSWLFIDGALVLNNAGVHVEQAISTQVSLTAGFHRIRVVAFDAAGPARLTLRWRTPGSSLLVDVPRSVLHPAPQSASVQVGNAQTVPQDTWRYTWDTTGRAAGPYQVEATFTALNAPLVRATDNTEVLNAPRPPPGSADALRASVIADAERYGPRETVELLARLQNPSQAYTYDVLDGRMRVLDGSGTVKIENVRPDLVLDPGSVSNWSVPWNTGTELPGVYRVILDALDENGAVVASDQDTFVIADPAGGLLLGTLSVNPVDAPVGTPIQFSGTIFNGGATTLTGITPAVRIVNAQNGTQMGQQVFATRSLLSSEEQQVAHTQVTTTMPAGDYVGLLLQSDRVLASAGFSLTGGMGTDGGVGDDGGVFPPVSLVVPAEANGQALCQDSTVVFRATGGVGRYTFSVDNPQVVLMQNASEPSGAQVGAATPLLPGTVLVTVTDEAGQMDSFEWLLNVPLAPQELGRPVGRTFALGTTLEPGEGSPLPTGSSWTVDDTAVAQMNGNVGAATGAGRTHVALDEGGNNVGQVTVRVTPVGSLVVHVRLADGTAVADARVFTGPWSALTDGQGDATLVDVPAGTHRVFVSGAAILQTDVSDVSVREGAGSRIEVVAVAAAMSLRGTVVGGNGEGLAGADVVALDTATRAVHRTRCGTDGSFVLGVPGDDVQMRWLLTASLERYDANAQLGQPLRASGSHEIVLAPVAAGTRGPVLPAAGNVSPYFRQRGCNPDHSRVQIAPFGVRSTSSTLLSMDAPLDVTLQSQTDSVDGILTRTLEVRMPADVTLSRPMTVELSYFVDRWDGRTERVVIQHADSPAGPYTPITTHNLHARDDVLVFETDRVGAFRAIRVAQLPDAGAAADASSGRDASSGADGSVGSPGTELEFAL